VTRLKDRRSDFDFRQEHFVQTAGPSDSVGREGRTMTLATRHSPLVFIEECVKLYISYSLCLHMLMEIVMACA
jgi:hypothetical protein